MSDGFVDMTAPGWVATTTADQVIHGPTILPQQRTLLYSLEQWDMQECAHFELKDRDKQVPRSSTRRNTAP